MKNPLMIIILIVVLIFTGLAIYYMVRSIINEVNPTLTPIPITEAQIAYKSVEGTGVFGRAEYYIFSKTGERFRVSQKMFDSLIDKPRK